MNQSTIDIARGDAEDFGRSSFLGRRFVRAAAWAISILLMYEFLVVVRYPFRDPDSSLYEAISASLVERPFAEWLAPLWPPDKVKSGLFVEHVPFFFWPPAALSRLGVARGAVLSNLFYFLGSLYLLFLIARPLVRREGAWAAVALYTISPLGIQYLVRGNHENAWAIGFLGALYCLQNLHRRRELGYGFVLFVLLAFLVKGILALAIFPVLGLWWWWSTKPKRDLVWFAASLAAIALVSLAYEWAYHRLTGESFFANYVGAQMAYIQEAEGGSVLLKLFNVFYYAANILWFALPSSLIAIYTGYRSQRAGQQPTEAQQLAYLTCGSYVVLLSMMTRRAARYMFPVYSLIHIPAAQAVCDRLPRLREWLLRNQVYLPYGLMILLALILVARVEVDLHLYRFIQVF